MAASGLKIVRATQARIRWAMGLLKALANIKGGNGIRVNLRPGVGIDVLLDRAAGRGVQGDDFAVVKLNDAGSDGDGWYTATEVLSDNPLADPPTWTTKEPGRTYGASEGDEGEVLHPLLITGLETTASGADPVYLVRRITRGGTNPPFWMIVGAAGGSELPTPTVLYQTLVALGDPLVWVPEWVRAHE